MAEGLPVAALDIGSNTIRLDVARPSGDGLETLLACSTFVRLGRGVNTTGMLRPDAQRRALETIAELVSRARDLGAPEIVAVATSAVRDAGNGPAFIERIFRETGVRAEVISGTREAELTYLGATLGIAITGPVIVADVGGGSAEVVSADARGLRWGQALPLGSGRMTERFVHYEPPTERETQRIVEHAWSLLATLPPAQARHGIFTGGSAKKLPVLLHLEGLRVPMSPEQLDEAVRILRTQPASVISQGYGIGPDRAKVLPAGAAVLRTIAAFYSLESVTVTHTGIREGIIVDQLQRQGRWAALPEEQPEAGRASWIGQ